MRIPRRSAVSPATVAARAALGALAVLGTAGPVAIAGEGTPVAAPAKPAPTSAPATSPVPPTTSTPTTSTTTGQDVLALGFADAVDDALVKAVASVEESSVTVHHMKKRPDGSLFRLGAGSGTFITWKSQGPFVFTNEHVIHGADALQIVTFDGSTYDVKLKDHVESYDIALLEFAGAKPKAYKAARFGKSEALVEGQWCIATGNPFFLATDGRCVATLGVISGLDRFLRGDFTYAGAIQHDAEVNPGNSGGPLWNLAGEMIGINGMISTRGDGSGAAASNTGASYAIPIHMVLKYIDDLLSDKVRASAGYLGIQVKNEVDKTGKPIGLRIESLAVDSPCSRVKADAKAKALPPVPDKGDVLVQATYGGLGGTKTVDLYTSTDLTNSLALYPAGTKVKLKFLRAGKALVWSGELGGAPTK